MNPVRALTILHPIWFVDAWPVFAAAAAVYLSLSLDALQ